MTETKGWAANVESTPLVAIDLSARHGMKAGDWGRRQDLSRIRLNCLGDSGPRNGAISRQELSRALPFRKGFPQ
jgi:hypothetical protein